jgi:Protein of unknown function (DUF2917)
MQQTVQFEEPRPTGSFNDCGSNSLVAEFDQTRPAGSRRAPQSAPVERPTEGWIRKITRAFLRMTDHRNRLEPLADSQLSKGWAKQMYLVDGGRISCRRGKLWITLDEGGEDIVLAACQSKSFGPGARVLVEALATSRISLEAL